MKIRLSQNAVRIRLTAEEIAALYAGKTVEFTTVFSAINKMTCRLNTWHLTTSAIALQDQMLTIQFPNNSLNEDNNFSFKSAIDNQSAIPLTLLIELDQDCKHG
jgi:hypothetical protein